MVELGMRRIEFSGHTGSILERAEGLAAMRLSGGARRGRADRIRSTSSGFTHCCGTDRQGKFQVVRLTAKKRMRATLTSIRKTLYQRRHEPVPVVGVWLQRVLWLLPVPRSSDEPVAIDWLSRRSLPRLAACFTTQTSKAPAQLDPFQSPHQ